MLSELEAAQVLRESVNSRNMDKLEKRADHYLTMRCGSPELLAKVGSMKRRLRLNGLALKQLQEVFDSAVADCTRTTARSRPMWCGSQV
jgi:hypothetical protein